MLSSTAGHASSGLTPLPWVLLAPRATICAAAELAETTNDEHRQQQPRPDGVHGVSSARPVQAEK
jgi:hypothetical protein